MTWEVLQADCIEALGAMPDESIDAIVTDPPAGISFMSKGWDHDKGGRDAWVAWLAEVMAECLRVAKPGAHALVWALPRTSHWTGWAIEEAGWEVRDRIAHHFGSGFPKSLDVSKAIDRAAGVEREVVGMGAAQCEHLARGEPCPGHDDENGRYGETVHAPLTAPATSEAQRWQGWGTALKPATEDWWLCRKPFIGTVAETVTKFGTGALNIDATRIGTDAGWSYPNGPQGNHNRGVIYGAAESSTEPREAQAGRWPANVCLSHIAPDENGEGGCEPVGERRVKGNPPPRFAEAAAARASFPIENRQPLEYADETVTAWRCAENCPVAELDLQSEGRMHGAGSARGAIREADESGMWKMSGDGQRYGDSGGASRFFATFSDRGLSEGADLSGFERHPPGRAVGSLAESETRFRYTAKASRAERQAGVGANAHPT